MNFKAKSELLVLVFRINVISNFGCRSLCTDFLLPSRGVFRLSLAGSWPGIPCQKSWVGTNSPCLLRLQTRKLPEQKNSRPHQVKLENGRSWSQNDFRILESMLRGFIAPASRADVYTTSASASNVFVYTKTLFALQNACWAVPKPLVFCIRWMQAARLHRLR